MIFNKFLETVKKYPNSPALNNWSFTELLDIVIDGSYQKVTASAQEYILIDILRAAYFNRSLVIPPKLQQDQIDIPETENSFNLYLYSSGSTGKKKSIKLTEKMIYSNFENAVAFQNLTNKDKILTVCSLNHTGGINAQSLPGLLIGSHVIVKPFNPYTLGKLLLDYDITVTHLIPVMIDSLFKLKKFPELKHLKIVVAGSDCIKKDHVRFFLEKNIPFAINYGLTEAGPIIINHKFENIKELVVFDHGVPLGTKIWSNYSFDGDELCLNGDCVINHRWLKTGDCVYKENNWFMYKGRISAGCSIVPKKY